MENKAQYAVGKKAGWKREENRTNGPKLAKNMIR